MIGGLEPLSYVEGPRDQGWLSLGNRRFRDDHVTVSKDLMGLKEEVAH